MEKKIVSIDALGRMSLPIKARKMFNAEKGGKILLEITNDKVVITNGDIALEAAQQIWNSKKKSDGKEVESFIKERRQEFEREEKK